MNQYQSPIKPAPTLKTIADWQREMTDVVIALKTGDNRAAFEASLRAEECATVCFARGDLRWLPTHRARAEAACKDGKYQIELDALAALRAAKEQAGKFEPHERLSHIEQQVRAAVNAEERQIGLQLCEELAHCLEEGTSFPITRAFLNFNRAILKSDRFAESTPEIVAEISEGCRWLEVGFVSDYQASLRLLGHIAEDFEKVYHEEHAAALYQFGLHLLDVTAKGTSDPNLSAGLAAWKLLFQQSSSHALQEAGKLQESYAIFTDLLSSVRERESINPQVLAQLHHRFASLHDEMGLIDEAVDGLLLNASRSDAENGYGSDEAILYRLHAAAVCLTENLPRRGAEILDLVSQDVDAGLELVPALKKALESDTDDLEFALLEVRKASSPQEWTVCRGLLLQVEELELLRTFAQRFKEEEGVSTASNGRRRSMILYKFCGTSQVAIMKMYAALATTYAMEGHTDTAREILADVEDMQGGLAGRPQDPDLMSRVAHAFVALSVTVGDLSEAKRYNDEGYRALSRHAGSRKSFSMGANRYYAGQIESSEGDRANACTLFAEAYDLFKSVKREKHPIAVALLDSWISCVDEWEAPEERARLEALKEYALLDLRARNGEEYF